MKYGPIGFLWSSYAFSFQSLAWGEQVGFKMSILAMLLSPLSFKKFDFFFHFFSLIKKRAEISEWVIYLLCLIYLSVNGHAALEVFYITN